jgi:hypothetical protein
MAWMMDYSVIIITITITAIAIVIVIVGYFSIF